MQTVDNGQLLFDREQLLHEIHERPPLSCGSFVRATRATYMFGSFKDELRKCVKLVLENAYADDNIPFSTIADVIRALGADPTLVLDDEQSGQMTSQYKVAAQNKTTAMKVIAKGYDLAKKEPSSREKRARALGVLKDIVESLDEAANQDAYGRNDEDNTEVINLEKEVFRWQAPYGEYASRFPSVESSRQERLDSISGMSRLDLFFKPSSTSAEPEDNNKHYRLRTRWEVFDHSQNISAIEDIAHSLADNPDEAFGDGFKNGREDALSAFFEQVERARNDPSRKLNLDKSAKVSATAHESIGDSIEGEKLSAARYWIVPIKWFLEHKLDKDTFGSSLAEPEQEQKEKHGKDSKYEIARIELYQYAREVCHQPPNKSVIHLDPTLYIGPGKISEEIPLEADAILAAIGRRAREWFEIKSDPHDPLDYIKNTQTNPKTTKRYRDDFVFSFVSDGRAILLSDLRPNDQETEKGNWERASRTLIIDLGMTAEQRGRLLSRCMDLATFRILALRGHPHANPAIDLITDIGKILNTLNLDDPLAEAPASKVKSSLFPLVKSKEKAEYKAKIVKRRSDLKRRLGHLNEVAQSLDQLNLFFTYGVTGKRLSTDVYSKQVRNRIEGLRENRIEGWQTLDEYMKRYFASAAQIDRLGDRYDNIRLRLQGAFEQLRSEFNQEQLEKLNEQADDHTSLMNRAVLYAGISALIAMISTAIATKSILTPPQDIKMQEEELQILRSQQENSEKLFNFLEKQFETIAPLPNSDSLEKLEPSKTQPEEQGTE